MTIIGTARATDHQTGYMPSQTATVAIATSSAALDLAALTAAAQLVRSYKPKDQFDSPPPQKSLGGRPFALELSPRESGFNKGCGFFASWSYDASKSELEIGEMPEIVFAGDTNPSGAFPNMQPTDQLNPVLFVCQRVAQSLGKASNAFGAVTTIQRSAEESLSLSTSNIGRVNKPYWTVHVEGQEARELAKAVRIRVKGVLGEWRPGQVIICYRQNTEATLDSPFARTTRDCMFKTDEIRFEIVDSRTQSVLYAWD
jgi:hypothetical protein